MNKAQVGSVYTFYNWVADKEQTGLVISIEVNSWGKLAKIKTFDGNNHWITVEAE